MSLFKSRDWWEINLNEIDTYDLHSLLTLTLDSDGFQSILLGSHEGFLRLFSPSCKIVNGEAVSDYEPSHLLLEVQLPSPILQINEGVLVSGSQEKQLAILHPRLFSVYDIKKKETKETKVGDQVVLELVYQHVLRHSAHSFVLGFFGGVRGRQFICIQSLDGLLSFYEQESFSFQLYLPNFSFPYAFTYLEKTDSFLFLNGFLNFVCYSYESLASSGNEKSIMKMWEYSLGEGILDVQTVVKDVLVITVLTERNLYGLNENGNLIFAKRLEYTPIAFCTYLTEEEKKLMIVIGTDEQYINVYEETNLKWSMKINITPVSIKRIFLDRLPGGLVLLSEDGLLKCTYVGTHPSVYLVSPLHESELDLTKTEAELIDLQKKITSNDLRDSFTADLISVVVRLNKTVRIEENVRKCDLFVEIDTQFYVKRLQVLIQVENPLVSSKPNTFLTNFSGRTFVESSISLVGRGIPSCLMIEVIVSYITSEGIVGCINKSETLPLSLVLTETPPIKEAHYKFTVVTNQTVLNMNQIFREFATEDATPNAIGLKYVNSDDIVVTIVAAKSSQRFRIQSDSIPAVTLPFFTLIDRLKQQFRKNSDFQLTYSAPLPLDSYYEFIQIHHDLIGNKNILRERLFKQSSQYIMIQKKILSNLKDPAPKPFSNFHKLLMETSKMISCTLEELEKTEYDLTSSRCSISSMNRLIPGLLELINIPENNIKPIKCLFNPFMYDAEEQGWLEIQNATSSFLLRKLHNKTVKDQEKQYEINLEPIKTTSKLIKHINAVVDRLIKNDYYSEPGKNLDEKGVFSTQDTEECFTEGVIPASTKYADLKKENNNEIKTDALVKEEKSYGGEERPETEIWKDEATPENSENITSTEKLDYSNENKNEENDAIWDLKVDDLRI